MKEQGVLIAIVDHCHTKDTDRCAKVLDVECGRKGTFKLFCPFRITAENQDIIDINCDEHNQGGSDKRVAGAVTF